MEQFIAVMAVIYLAIGVFCAFGNRRYWKMQADRHPNIAKHLLQDQWVDFIFESMTIPTELLFSSKGRMEFFNRLGTDKPDPSTTERLVPGLHVGKPVSIAEFVTSCRECGETFPLKKAWYISGSPLCPDCFNKNLPAGGWRWRREPRTPSIEEIIAKCMGADLTRH